MGELRARERRVGQLDHDPESLVWARKQAGYTQLELAVRIGVSPGHMSQIESGKRNATPVNLTKIAKVLRCPRAAITAKVAPDVEVAS